MSENPLEIHQPADLWGTRADVALISEQYVELPGELLVWEGFSPINEHPHPISPLAFISHVL